MAATLKERLVALEDSVMSVEPDDPTYLAYQAAMEDADARISEGKLVYDDSKWTSYVLSRYKVRLAELMVTVEKERAAAQEARAVKVAELRKAFGSDYYGERFLLSGAYHFTGQSYVDADTAAEALLAYFEPSGSKSVDDRRRANGYTVTTNPYTIKDIVLRVRS